MGTMSGTYAYFSELWRLRKKLDKTCLCAYCC